jgi:hypothetical protein
MTEYFQSKHVHLRWTSEGGILLDLRRDEYLTLNQDQATILREILRVPGSNSPDDGATIPGSNAEDLSNSIRTLLARGIITTDPTSGKRATQVELHPADSACAESGSIPSARHSLHRAWHFLLAYVRTWLALRFGSLDRTIAVIERRKRKHQASQQLPAYTLQELTQAFLLMRPLFYTQKDKCLFDSVTLVHFLAAYGVFPELVFGIRTRPFEAHAWVQTGNCSLNYPAENVRGYIPIMAI